MGRYMRQIYALGYPSILMQSLYTVYIMVLNIILAGFSDAAVTVLACIISCKRFSLFRFRACKLASCPF